MCPSVLNSQYSQPSANLFLKTGGWVLARMAELECQQQFVGRKHKCQEVDNGINDSTRVERSEGILDVKVGGKMNQSTRCPRGRKTKKR